MLFLFKHKNNRKQDKQQARQDKIAECIVKRCMMAQHKASNVLQDKFEMLSQPVKKSVVVIFCFISFGSCFYLILKSFGKHTDKFFSITTINVPKQAESELRSSQAPHGVTKAELERIIKFRGYLDSLAKRQSGKRILDSILLNRPGLTDSLALMEKVYQLQSSNK